MWLALAVWVLDVALFSTAGSNLGQVGPGNLSPLGLIGFAALGAAALLWRRRAPLAVFGIVWLHAMIGTTLISGYQPVLGLLVTVFTIGSNCSRARAWVIAPAVLPPAVVAVNEAWLSEPDRRVPVFLGLLAFFTLLTAGVWVLGYWTAVSSRRLAESQRLRQIEAELAVTNERARISRELHDIVAHTVTMMVLQAAGAQRILRDDPQRAEGSLAQIAELGRAAMNELRRMLALIQPASPSQVLGLDDLDDLLRTIRGSGIAVDLAQEGTPRVLDASVSLAAYRTVQEALTNAAKHAGPQAAARVRLAWTDRLLVEVIDTGAGVQATNSGLPTGAGVQATNSGLPTGAGGQAANSGLSTGNGLLGLRERVSIAGGRLEAAPREQGGFRVAATLPYTAD
ncbi:MAG TPA: histidine kinase [Candidatus Limnocylindrales bacterium]